MKLSHHLLMSFIIIVLVTTTAMAGELTIPNTFESGKKAIAADVNANFSEVKKEVDDNNSRINTNAGNIDTNTGNIDTNTTDIGDIWTAVNENAQAITNKQDKVTDACASGFTRIGFWCLDTDGKPSVTVRNTDSNENNSGSTATNLDTLLGLGTGTVKAAIVGIRLREIANAASATAIGCVASVSLGPSDILSCSGVAIDTGLTTSQAMWRQAEYQIPVDANGDIYTICMWGSGTSSQAACSWYIRGYID